MDRPLVLALAPALALGAASAAQAAGLYGSLTVDGQRPAAEMAIELACEASPVRRGRVEPNGSWRITVEGAAKNCKLVVDGASAPAVVYAAPTRYDLALTRQGGTAQLKPR